MMNAYFFQMNNLKGLAADESGSIVLVVKLARSGRFAVWSTVAWTSSVWCAKRILSSGQQSATQSRIWLYYSIREDASTITDRGLQITCAQTNDEHQSSPLHTHKDLPRFMKMLFCMVLNGYCVANKHVLDVTSVEPFHLAVICDHPLVNVALWDLILNTTTSFTNQSFAHTNACTPRTHRRLYTWTSHI